MRKNLFFAIVLVSITVTGCRGGFVPGGGKVTFEDGSPVTFGGIVFETENFMAEGRINADGSYTLYSLKVGDGLPPGKYKVGISSREVDDRGRPTYYVDPQFSNPATSGLSAEVVKRGQNRFDFTVTKPKKRAGQR